jgi:hypothetical protein
MDERQDRDVLPALALIYFYTCQPAGSFVSAGGETFGAATRPICLVGEVIFMGSITVSAFFLY